MEDPWGASPWTTPTSAAETEKSLEPPPRAFLTSAVSSSSIPELSYSSPWANDDADWSTSTSLNVWGSENTKPRSRENSIHSLSSRPRSRDNSLGSKAWPATAAVSPRATRALSRSSSSSLLKLPAQSPLDPWVSETSPGLPLSPPKAAVSLGFDATRLDSPHSIPDTPLGLDQINQIDLVSPKWDQDDDGRKHRLDITLGGVAAGDGIQTPDDVSPGLSYEAKNDGGTSAGASDYGADKERGRSRASSSCSEDSLRDKAMVQDSPITSTDEDSRLKPALGPHQLQHTPSQRRVSAKVSDLAKMFDGAAKSVSPATSIPRPPPSTRKNFKELVEVARTSSTSSVATVTTSIPRPPPSTRASFQTLVEAANTSTQPDLPGVSVPRPPPPTRANFQELVDKFGSVQHQSELTAKYGDVQFTTDLKAVDLLFEELGLAKQTDTADARDAQVSDTIVMDTFSSISERRVWYRISRQGTQRLHDAGGDEYYRRVKWPTSEVRNETIQIVRRWMEEDSVMGRPNLGGKGFGGAGSKGKGNMFGWDSPVPDEPVNLDEVFKRKRRSAPPAPRKAEPEPAPTMMLAAPVASFGWSSIPPVQATAVTPKNGFSWGAGPSQPSTAAASRARPVSMMETLRPLSPPKTSGPSKQQERGYGDDDNDDNDDDDDWGEMVTSPGAKGDAPTDPSFAAMQNFMGGGNETTSLAVASPPASQKQQAVGEASSKMVEAKTEMSFFGPSDLLITTAEPKQALPTQSLSGTPDGLSSLIPPKPAPATVQMRTKKAVAFSEELGSRPTNEEEEQAEALRVVQNLPDLSYMLR